MIFEFEIEVDAVYEGFVTRIYWSFYALHEM